MLLRRVPRKDEEMQVGDLVKFKEPREGEAGDRFMVLELRGDRVLVRDENEYWKGRGIIPTAVYLIEDLVLCED